MTQLAVLGSPIQHSRSPLIHAAAYAALRLDWSYTRVRCGASALAGFLRGRGPEWRGLSLTMPLKEEAFRLASSVDSVARESGVVNTLVHRADGGWDGFNTDVGGLASAVERAGHDASRTLVIGSGATAVSALLAARRLGADRIDIVARNRSATDALVARFDGTREHADSDPVSVTGSTFEASGALFAEEGSEASPSLVISTLPGPAAAQTALPAEATRTPLFDVAYDPWPSPFASRWAQDGGIVSPGIAMLVEQAIIQIRIFVSGDPYGELPDEQGVRAAIAQATARAT